MSEPVAPPPPPPSDSGDRNLMLILSYLGLLAIIPLVMKKEDAEVQWHAKHGLVQLVFFFAVYVVISIVSALPLGCFFAFLYPITGLAWLIVVILSIMKATQGQRFLIPGLSQFADKF